MNQDQTPLLTNNEPTAPIIVPLEPSQDDTFVQIQDGVTFVPYQHCCGCTRSPNLVGLFFNFLLWCATLFMLICLFLHLPLPFVYSLLESDFGKNLILPIFFLDSTLHLCDYLGCRLFGLSYRCILH